MPIIERAEGRRLISEIYGVMHYPAAKDRAKRDQLADWFEARRFAWDVEEKIEAGNHDRYTNWHIKVLKGLGSRGDEARQNHQAEREIADIDVACDRMPGPMRVSGAIERISANNPKT